MDAEVLPGHRWVLTLQTPRRRTLRVDLGRYGPDDLPGLIRDIDDTIPTAAEHCG